MGVTTQVKYEIINQMRCAKHPRLDIESMCKFAGVSRSGYYGYTQRKRQLNQREIQDEIDFEYVLEAYKYRDYDKGAKPIKMYLDRHKHRMNLKKIRRLMHKYGLFCPIRKINPYRRMAKAMATNRIADNLLERNFKQGISRKTLLTDITYLIYGRDQLAYLSVIKDSSTNKILGYMPSESLDVSFVVKTVNLMFECSLGCLDFNVILHSDQGCHYTSHAFQDALNHYGIASSMSRRANCWDNSPQESFFGHMKDELKRKLKRIQHYSELVEVLIDYFDYYNYDRPQWGLNRMTPNEYEEYLDRADSKPLQLPMSIPPVIIYL